MERPAAATFWRSPTLVIGFFAASTSGACILAASVGWIPLAWSVAVLAPLTAILFPALAVRAGRGREDVFLDRFLGGLKAGASGLLAYDLLRLLILLSGMVPFNPFRPIEVFGLLIVDRYQDSVLTKSVGWAFHLWNGLAFAVMYTLAVGPGRLWWAFGWAMMLETAMLVTYPSLFHLVLAWPMIVMSLAGHAAYGLAAGAVAERTVRW